MVKTLDRARIDFVDMQLWSTQRTTGFANYATILALKNEEGSSLFLDTLRQGDCINGFDNDVIHVKASGVCLPTEDNNLFRFRKAWNLYWNDVHILGVPREGFVDGGGTMNFTALQVLTDKIGNYTILFWERTFIYQPLGSWERWVKREYVNPRIVWDSELSTKVLRYDQVVYSWSSPFFGHWEESSRFVETAFSWITGDPYEINRNTYKELPEYLNYGQCGVPDDPYDVWFYADFHHPYFANSSKVAAFNEACDGFEHLDMNNIDNVRQAISSGTELLQRSKVPKPRSKTWKFASIFQKAANAWLWYRYSFCTTKSDIEECYHNLSPVFENLRSAPKMGRYGTVTDEYSVTYRCEVVAHNTCIEKLANLGNDIRSLGFAPTLANLWDMVPWSFAVDWFLKLGDFLDSADKALLYHSTQYTFDRICYSRHASWQSPWPGITITWYQRWAELSPPKGFGWVRQSASGNTVTKRVLDSVSLWVSAKL